MDRLQSVLMLLLIVVVTGVGVVAWRADQNARDSSARLECIARVQATASLALMAPQSRVDEQGRIAAIRTLSQRLDAC